MFNTQQRHTRTQISHLKPNTSVEISTFEQNSPSHVSAAQETSCKTLREQTSIHHKNKT